MLDKLFSFEKSRLSGVITAACKHRKSCCMEERSKLCSMCINTTRSNGLKLHKGKFTLDIKKPFLTAGIVQCWNSLSGGKVLKGCRETLGICRGLHFLYRKGPSFILSHLCGLQQTNLPWPWDPAAASSSNLEKWVVFAVSEQKFVACSFAWQLMSTINDCFSKMQLSNTRRIRQMDTSGLPDQR